MYRFKSLIQYTMTHLWSVLSRKKHYISHCLHIFFSLFLLTEQVFMSSFPLSLSSSSPNEHACMHTLTHTLTHDPETHSNSLAKVIYSQRS